MLEKLFFTYVIKGATKLYFMHYLRVVIILLSKGFYKSAFSAYSLGKTRFSSFWVLDFHISISLDFSFYFFCSMFWIHCHLKKLKTFFNFDLTYSNYLLKQKNCDIKNMLLERFVKKKKNLIQLRKTWSWSKIKICFEEASSEV